MQTFSRPDLIVFDLDNTIYSYAEPNDYATEQLFKFLSQEISTEIPVLRAAFSTARLTVKQRLGDTGSSHSRLLYLNEMFRIMALNPRPSFLLRAEQVFWSSYMQKMTPKSGIEEFIATARHLKITLALVSDLTLQIQLKKILALSLDNAFDYIYVSEELGGDKKTGIPLRELKNLFQNNNGIWFIGDSHFDFLDIQDGNEFFVTGNAPLTVSKKGNTFTDYFELEKILRNSREL